MDGFYDREVGVAWGPITKEEIMDDILIYGCKNVTRRKTVDCNPSFNDKEKRYNDLTQNSMNTKQRKVNVVTNINMDSILISSDEDNSYVHCETGNVKSSPNSLQYFEESNHHDSDLCSDEENQSRSSDIMRLQSPYMDRKVDEHIDNLEMNHLDVQSEHNEIHSINIDENHLHSTGKLSTSNDILHNVLHIKPIIISSDEEDSHLNHNTIIVKNSSDSHKYLEESNHDGNDEENQSHSSDIMQLQSPCRDDKISDDIVKIHTTSCKYSEENDHNETDSINIDGNQSYSSVIEQLESPHRQNEIDEDIGNVNISYIDIKDRLPTPANLDEHTYDEMYDFEEEERNHSNAVNVPFSTSIHITKEEDNYNKISKTDGDDGDEDMLSGGVKATLQNNPPEIKIQECLSHSYDDNDDENDSHIVFNDTLAEIERLLNGDANNSTQSDIIKENENLLARPDPLLPSSTLLHEAQTPTTKPKEETHHTKTKSAMKPSCLPVYNRTGTIKKIPAKMFPKSPITPLHTDQNSNKHFVKPMLTPSNIRHDGNPSSAMKKRFKDIESPISVYIKNSGVAPLYKKVTPSKPLNCEKIKVTSGANKENSVIFPEVIYKPAKRTIVTKDKGMKIPNKIESLIPQKTNVIRHEGRLGGSANKESIGRKLLAEDLTVSDSFNTTDDISVIFSKRAFIS